MAAWRKQKIEELTTYFHQHFNAKDGSEYVVEDH